MQARSRLKSDSNSPISHLSQLLQPRPHLKFSSVTQALTQFRFPTHTLTVPSFRLPQGYFAKIPTLGMSIFWYVVCIYICTSIYPSQIQNTIFPQSYLPFQLSLFLANWFGFSYLLLHSRRGIIAAFFVQTIVFLQLQHVQLQGQVLLGLLAFFVIIERLGSMLEKRPSAVATHNANIKKTFDFK